MAPCEIQRFLLIIGICQGLTEVRDFGTDYEEDLREAVPREIAPLDAA